MKTKMVLGNSKTAQAAQTQGIDGSVDYVIAILKDIDDGKEVYTDFISSPDVNDFCQLANFKTTWAGKAFQDIAQKSVFGPRVVDKHDASLILQLLQQEITKGTFTPKYPEDTPEVDNPPFDTQILQDFLPKPDSLGHLWEFQFALGVELEHGRTRGTNVSNNHPLLTGMIVMAHLTEDTLYYARLWVMEVEGELFNARRKGEAVDDFLVELDIARQYLAKRLTEKLAVAVPV